ncbi:MAG TPA: chemotaxis protein CheA [Anaerolineae bacterium]|nr:chemotaxis protein CheA [Anaerolineae bacterium]
MEDYNPLISLIDNMASDFLFIDGKKIDVPAAGKFFSKLNALIKEADSRKIFQLKNVAAGLNSLLEKIVLNEIDDEEAGFNAFEKGIILMQKIGESFKNTGGYEGDIETFAESISALTGEQRAESNKQPTTSVVEVQDESLLRDFIIEGLEYIDEIEVNILNLEQDPENKDYINNIFRPFHSIKGVASFLNLDQIRELAHSLETLLDRARNGELSVTSGVIDVILDGADGLKAMIVKLRDDFGGKPEEPLKIDLPALMARIESVKVENPEIQERKKVGEILVEEGVITKEVLEQGLKIAKQTVPPKKIGEILIAECKATPKQVSGALRNQANPDMDTAATRVNIKKLDDLIDMVGELVITQSMIRQSPIIQANGDRKLTKNIAQLTSITSELQRTSTRLRMVPIKQSFQRMSRLIRDLSKSSGKLIDIVTEGEDTEIDRNMVNEIYSPLVHMIRNAVDHGIELPEERVKLGKTEKGMIQLRAYHGGGNVVIEISDNGKGLDRDSILKKAVENGIIDDSHGLSDQDVYKLIFLPGFSTAAKVTDISGRGVGMDVVKQAVEKLRGKIEIYNVYGKGVTVTARFPLTMAIINGMVVRIGDEKYIIPITAIRKLLRPAREAYNKVVGKGEMINVMGNLLPLVRLYKLFGIEPEHKNPWEAVTVVVEGENRSKCLLVDEIIGGEEVVIKSLGEGLKSARGVSGGAIMGDGNVGLILDTESLFELSESLG